MAGGPALLRADVAAGAFFGARPPVDFLAVCLVLRQRQRAETEGASGSLAEEITLPFCFSGCGAAFYALIAVTVTDVSDGDPLRGA